MQLQFRNIDIAVSPLRNRGLGENPSGFDKPSAQSGGEHVVIIRISAGSRNKKNISPPELAAPSQHHASYGRTRTYQPFFAKHGDRLFRNAFTDFQNLGKIAYRRQNFAGLIKTRLDGRTQSGGDLTCQIAATRTVK